MAKKTLQTLARIIVFLIILTSIHGCSTPGSYMIPSDMKKPVRTQSGDLIFPEFIPIEPRIFPCKKSLHTYRIGPRDILTIIVWNHPELTIPSMQTTSENVNIYTHVSEATNSPSGILVSERGEIFFPLAGKLKVSGLTVDEIRTRLTQRLIKFIRNPQVSIRVSAFRSKPVYIIGEVSRPGIQPVTDVPMTIMDAINQSGGIDKDGADAHYIYVIRGNFNHPKVYWLDASSPAGVLMAEHFLLQSRDIVLVTTAGVTRWSRVVNRILPTIQTFLNPPVNMQTDPH